METKKPRFTQALKDKWLKALRSGEYKQGTGRLHNPHSNTYCCLGVLQDIAGIECSSIILLRDIKTRETAIEGLSAPQGCDEDGKFLSSQQSDLAALNDDGLNFCDIARYIEMNIPALPEESDCAKAN